MAIIGVDIDQLTPTSDTSGTVWLIIRRNGVDYKITKADFNSGNVGAAIPLWNASLIFNTTDNRFCVDPSTNRFWRSKVDANQNNQPPQNPVTTEDDNWIEISPKESSAIKEWEPGWFFSDHVVVKRLGRLVELINPARPYDSVDIEAEIAGGDWRYIPIGAPTSGGAYQNNYASIPAMITGQGDQTSGAVQFVADASADFPAASQGDPTVETAGTWAEYIYLGTTNGNLTDYRKRAEQESMDVAPGGGGDGTGVFEPVQDITALKAIDTTEAGDFPDKWAILVEDEGGWYRLDRDSAVSESLPHIVAPTTGVGRWFSMPNIDLSGKADKDDTISNGELLQKKDGGNYEGSGYPASILAPIDFELLAFAASIEMDVSGKRFTKKHLTLTSNANFEIINALDGYGGVIEITQGGAGGYSLLLGAASGTSQDSDDFTGTTIDTGKWTVSNSNPDRTISQNDELIISCDGTATGNPFTTTVLSIIDHSKPVTIQSNFSIIKANINCGFGLWINANNHAVIQGAGTSTQYRLRVVIGGSAVYDTNTSVTSGKDVRITYSAGNVIGFWYWDSGTSAWVQMGTYTGDIGANPKTIFYSAGAGTSGNIATWDDYFVTDDITYTAQYPSVSGGGGSSDSYLVLGNGSGDLGLTATGGAIDVVTWYYRNQKFIFKTENNAT